MKRTRTLISAFIAIIALSATAVNQREKILFDEGWSFAFGDASSPERDFGCGTEYFTYLTKAASIHNEGPYSPKFDAAKWGKEWATVNLPHDWVVDLPFAAEASHSHGYKTVGYKYPETSVGWYRKTFFIPESDKGRQISLQFDGIFRDAQVWVNGFYLGNEPSGYAEQRYNISEYLNYGGDNLVTVRCDASIEEGWFYEGAGIYRHVWLNKTSPIHIDETTGIFAYSELNDDFSHATLNVETNVSNESHTTDHKTYDITLTLYDDSGRAVATQSTTSKLGKPQTLSNAKSVLDIDNPKLWSIDSPYLYTLRTDLSVDGNVVDSKDTKIGIRKVAFDPDNGFILNGKKVKLKGVNMHQDHAGVGAAIPDALHTYRLKELKKYGVNAYRSSHNPASPAVLDACDSLGIVVIDENRLTGVNDYHKDRLSNMIYRDRNHPSVILYSVGNEEWGIEWNEFGERIVETMRDYCHAIDPTRLMTVASSSGPTVLVPADVAGYNYIMQNPVDEHRANYPKRCAVGSEETSGCGTRGIYYDDPENGRMAALNRAPNGTDSILNCIERGWKFYDERPWLGGLFYWTGFDYRGEPNPLVFPATGSEFGILDYCGFPKDEAYYLKSWWTEEPTLHVLPHWNLKGHEGESIDIWVYSNCDEVELIANGKKLGKKAMPKNGHLSWTATYQPGYVKAIGYKGGKKAMEERIETTGEASALSVDIDRSTIKGDNQDVAVCNIRLIDDKGRFVPDACDRLMITVDGPIRILGGGNGDPAFRDIERPTDTSARTFEINAFNGLAQVLLQSDGNDGAAHITVKVGDNAQASATIDCVKH